MNSAETGTAARYRMHRHGGSAPVHVVMFLAMASVSLITLAVCVSDLFIAKEREQVILNEQRQLQKADLKLATNLASGEVPILYGCGEGPLLISDKQDFVGHRASFRARRHGCQETAQATIDYRPFDNIGQASASYVIRTVTLTKSAARMVSISP